VAVAPNTAYTARRGTVTIAGQVVEVLQAAPAAAVSAASFAPNTLAMESIGAVFGAELSLHTAVATPHPLPDTLAGTRVAFFTPSGEMRFALLFFISPAQINFQVPTDVAQGKTLLFVIHTNEAVASTSLFTQAVSPGLFAANANGQGVASGLALRIKADGSQSYEPLARYDAAQQRYVAVPINLGPATDRVFLVLFGTGFRHRSSLSAETVTIGGVNAEVLYAGAQGAFVGLDQLNLALLRALAGRGEVEIAGMAETTKFNQLRETIQ
jgi:uncharacterized protein (TIGR03437 family)